jgi:hypothetical protein
MSTPLPNFGLQSRGCKPFIFVPKRRQLRLYGLTFTDIMGVSVFTMHQPAQGFYFVNISMDGISIDGCLDRFFCRSLLCTANTFNFYHVKI